MFIKKLRLSGICLVMWGVFFVATAFSMGSKPAEVQQNRPSFENAEKSSISLKELADVYWPDSNATTLQQEVTLKNLLGKSVTWEITVAEIQRDGNAYLVQGQSDKNMLGTFSYVTPRNKQEETAIVKTGKGDTLKIIGIVSDMRLRHIVLNPATLSAE